MSTASLPYAGYLPFVTYGTRRLTDSSPAQSFTEPLSVTEMQDYLKIPVRSPADTAEIALLRSFISGARAAVEEEQGGLELIARQWDHYFDYWPASSVIPIGNPLQSVELVQYRDSDNVLHTLTENTDYIVDTAKRPGIIAPTYNASLPSFTAWPSSAVMIRYTSGYRTTDAWWSGETGEKNKNAMRWLISEWFNKRLLDTGNATDVSWQLRMCLSGGVPPRAR
jgi:uncharacterized phiE125 gp8 family phage protein